jgi:hypothetical protein
MPNFALDGVPLGLVKDPETAAMNFQNNGNFSTVLLELL